MRLDDATLFEFVHTTYPRLVGAVTLITDSRAAAEDAVQEALARAWERGERGEYIESLPAWVTTVSVNLARSGLRRLWAERRAGERLATLGPKDHATEIGERVDLGRALAALPRRHREATVLHYYLGLPVKEVASVMGCREGTVKSLLARARRSLAAALGVNELEEVAGNETR